MILIIIAIAVINYNIRDGVRFRARVQVIAMKDNNFWTIGKPLHHSVPYGSQHTDGRPVM